MCLHPPPTPRTAPASSVPAAAPPAVAIRRAHVTHAACVHVRSSIRTQKAAPWDLTGPRSLLDVKMQFHSTVPAHCSLAAGWKTRTSAAKLALIPPSSSCCRLWSSIMRCTSACDADSSSNSDSASASSSSSCSAVPSPAVGTWAGDMC